MVNNAIMSSNGGEGGELLQYGGMDGSLVPVFEIELEVPRLVGQFSCAISLC